MENWNLKMKKINLLQYFNSKLSYCLLVLIILSINTSSWSANVTYKSLNEEIEKLYIISNTDIYAINPLIRKFQELNPNTTIEYSEYQSNELFEISGNGCLNNEFYADLVISSAMAHQFKLANDGCGSKLNSVNLKYILGELPNWAKWSDELVGLTFEPAATVINEEIFNGPHPKTHIDINNWIIENPNRVSRIGTYNLEESGVGKLFDFEDIRKSKSSLRLKLALEIADAQYFCCTSKIIDLVADGHLDLGYNVLGSYALFRADLDERLKVIFLEDFTPVITRTAYIPNNAKNHILAERFINFTLSSHGEEILNNNNKLLSSLTGQDYLNELHDRKMNFLKPIELSPELLIVLERSYN